jgi:hypothetical protein
MGDIIAQSRVRYPPFESSLKRPEYLPIIVREVVMETDVGDLDETMKTLPATVRLGSEDSWLVERTLFFEDEDGQRREITGGYSLDNRDFPPLVEHQRVGWYLTPDPIHAKARSVISFAVILLLIALFYQTIEPLLLWSGIITLPIGSVQIGLLDYPSLMVFVVPLMIFPLVLRIAANLRDLRQQRDFLSSQPVKPEITFTSEPVSDEPLRGTINLRHPRPDWNGFSVLWRVGVLPPARESMLEAHGAKEGGQPPPGLSTSLPHYWEDGLSDGTGVGEDTPMEHHDVKGGLFLRPMRICAQGEMNDFGIEGGDFSLSPPKGDWPGTQAGSFVRFHWELLVRIERTHMRPLFWLMPIRVRHGAGPFIINDISVFDGRIEESPR